MAYLSSDIQVQIALRKIATATEILFSVARTIPVPWEIVFGNASL
jgi:hypothetical protein